MALKRRVATVGAQADKAVALVSKGERGDVL
jgi:hypothetical protein